MRNLDPKPISMSANQIRELQVPRFHLAIWAMGQQGYLFKSGATTVIIDPYLSDYSGSASGSLRPDRIRLVPPPMEPESLSMVDVVLLTHNHADHCDPVSVCAIMSASPQATLLAPNTCIDILVSGGVPLPRILIPKVDELLGFSSEFTVTSIPSAHYAHDFDSDGNPAYLGYVFNLNGTVVYHAGDTVMYDGLIERLAKHQIDIACLPINGRDWFREQEGLVGNIDYREAAELAVRTGVRVLIPGHNDMFATNRVNPALIVDYLDQHHPHQRLHFLRAGELYYFAG